MLTSSIRRGLRRQGLALLAALALSACSGRGYTVAPLTPSPTAERHHGKFVWYDLLTHDTPAAERFYGELFGWEFDTGTDGGDAYTAILNRGREVVFAVAGADKAKALRAVLDGPSDSRRLPAQLVRPQGRLIWLVDREAAACLGPSWRACGRGDAGDDG